MFGTNSAITISLVLIVIILLICLVNAYCSCIKKSAHRKQGKNEPLYPKPKGNAQHRQFKEKRGLKSGADLANENHIASMLIPHDKIDTKPVDMAETDMFLNNQARESHIMYTESMHKEGVSDIVTSSPLFRELIEDTDILPDTSPIPHNTSAMYKGGVIEKYNN
jgi:hypothetical protein